MRIPPTVFTTVVSDTLMCFIALRRLPRAFQRNISLPMTTWSMPLRRRALDQVGRKLYRAYVRQILQPSVGRRGNLRLTATHSGTTKLALRPNGSTGE